MFNVLIALAVGDVTYLLDNARYHNESYCCEVMLLRSVVIFNVAIILFIILNITTSENGSKINAHHLTVLLPGDKFIHEILQCNPLMLCSGSRSSDWSLTSLWMLKPACRVACALRRVNRIRQMRSPSRLEQ